MSNEYQLKFTNSYGEVFWFVGHGLDSRNGRKLIGPTDSDQSRGHEFSTAKRALAAWIGAGRPKGWEIVDNTPFREKTIACQLFWEISQNRANQVPAAYAENKW